MSKPVSCSLSKPLVLMVPYPLHGHVTPLLQAAKLLAARGFTVTFVLNDLNMKKMGEANPELIKMGITLVGIWDNLQEKIEANLVKEPKDVLECLPLLVQSFDELVRKMVEEEGLTIACIISDSFLLGTQDVANKWRIPRVAFWPNSLAALACSMSLPDISLASSLDPFKPQVYEGNKGDVLTCIPGIPELDVRNLPFYTMGFAYNETWLRTNLQSQLARVKETLCIISNSFPDLEREVHTQLQEIFPSTPILALGPLLPSGLLNCQDYPDLAGTGANLLDADHQDCIQWLDTQKPASVLYISMGSIVRLPERDIQEIALGLQASKQPFLWALSSPPCESALLLVSQSQGKVVRWAPQLRVLAHKAIGGFFTHCGWNSTLESISMGKPVIGWPTFQDQMTNCWFLVQKLKVGVRLELDESLKVSHMAMEKSIRILMQEEEGHLLRERSTHFHSLAQIAYTTSLPSNLDTLVNMILASTTSSINPK